MTNAGDRYPPIAPEAMTERQAEVVREIEHGPRGWFGGPFVPLLRTPDLLHRLESVGDYLRFRSGAEGRCIELAILIVAAQWRQGFEWAVHVPLALEAGVPRIAIEALARGERPAELDAPLAAVYELHHQLEATARVDDAAFASARSALGDAGVVEVVATIGYYTTLAMILNTAGTPAPRRPPVVALPDAGP